MLNTRYIHLHEALGLGPMWLHNNARVLSPIVPSHPTETEHKSTDNLTLTTPKKPSASSARLAVLQKITAAAEPENRANEDKIAEETAAQPSDLTSPVSGSLKPVRVMVLSVCASPNDVAAGQLFSGEDGVLLGKMFAAIQLAPENVHLTTWLKDLPDFNPKPEIAAVQAALPRVQAEYQACGEPVLLLLGDFFQRPDVMEQVRQLGDDVRHFHIAHPMRIASNSTLKRPAWATLQALQRELAA